MAYPIVKVCLLCKSRGVEVYRYIYGCGDTNCTQCKEEHFCIRKLVSPVKYETSYCPTCLKNAGGENEAE